jgi:hypothetical protein
MIAKKIGFLFICAVFVGGIRLSACKTKATVGLMKQSTYTRTASTISTSLLPTSTTKVLQRNTPVPKGTQTPETEEFDRFKYYQDYESYELDILAYLNSGRSPYLLEASLRSVKVPKGITSDSVRLTDPVVVLEDVTGDGEYEVIILLRWQSDALHVDFERILLILSQEGEKYNTLARIHARSLVERPYDMDLENVQDINLDGRNEIVLTIPDFQGPGGLNFLYVTFILAWNGAEFQHLIQVPEEAFLQPYSSGAGALNQRPALVDNDGDGILEVIVNHHGFYPGGSSSYLAIETGPMRGRTEIWSWDGKNYPLKALLNPPMYRFHVVQDADDATLVGDYELAMSLYLQAIFDDELHGWGTNLDKMQITEPVGERYRLSAYATFRIMVLHALWGNEIEMERDLETMLEYYPEGSVQYPFTEMASVFLDAYQDNGDVRNACEKASAYAESAVYLSPETMMSEVPLLSMLGSSYYGWYNRDYTSEDICPF